MGKSSKKSTIEIAPAAVSVPPSKLAKKGKRDAEVVLEKPVSAKKQRKVVVDVQTKQNVDKKPKKVPAPKKKTETSSSEDTSSDSEEEVKIAPKKVGKPVKLPIKDSSSSEESSSDEEVKPANSFKKLPDTGVKKAIAVASKKKEESSDEDSDSSSDEKNKSVTASNKPPVTVKSVSFNIDSDIKQDVTAKAASIVKKPISKVKPNASKKKEESSESSSSDSDSDSDSDDEDDAPKFSVTTKSGPTALKAAVTTAAKMKDESSDSSESDSDSDEEVPPAIPQKKPEATQKVPPAIIPPKRPEATQKKPPNKAMVEESSEDSSDESASESDEEQRKKLKVPESMGLNASKSTMKGAEKESSSSDDDSSEESSDEEPQRKKLKESTGLNASKPTMKGAKKESSSSDEDEDNSSEESSDEETPKAQLNKPIKPPTKQPIKSSSSDEESEDDSSDESEEELPVKTPAKKETDLKRQDAPTDQIAKNFDKRVEKVPADNQSFSSGSKTLFVGNLSFHAGDDEIMEFFKVAGEVTNIRLARFDDGQVRGFGHVEFATPEAAQKALYDLNGQELLGRAVKLDLARERGERGSFTPNYGMGNKSFQKAEKGQSHTIFVRGFDNSLEMNQIQSSLEEYFGSCGEITRISLPRDYETGGSKGIGYLDFRTEEAFSKALELSGSELGGYTLSVEEAKPKSDGGSGGRGGGWSGGRSGGRGGRGGRDGGGWSGGRVGGRGRDGGGYRGRGNGRGGGGRYGTGTQSQGKKTTFSDD